MIFNSLLFFSVNLYHEASFGQAILTPLLNTNKMILSFCYYLLCCIKSADWSFMNEKEFLQSYDINNFDRPSIATDIAVFSIIYSEDETNYRKESESLLKLLMVKRNDFPFKDMWALPGGFLRKDEIPANAAFRELKEETGVNGAFLRTLDIFGEPNRDPRGWIISHAYLALIDSGSITVSAGSDAKEACWFTIDVSIEELSSDLNASDMKKESCYTLTLKGDCDVSVSAKIKRITKYVNFHEQNEFVILEQNGFAFDHSLIILKAYLELKDMTEKDGRIVFDLLPEYFTLYRLQKAFEIILGKELLAANFRRKMSDYVIETDKMDTGNGHRPAKLFIRNLEKF